MAHDAPLGQQMTPEGSGVIVANLDARDVIIEHAGTPCQGRVRSSRPTARRAAGDPTRVAKNHTLPESTRTPVLSARAGAGRRAVTADLDAMTLPRRAHGDSQTARTAYPATGAVCPAPTSGMS